jgi:hypothetical protein
MRRIGALAAVLAVLLAGCREVRVKSYAQGTTPVLGGAQIAVVRNKHDLAEFGIHAPVKFNHEFGVVLLMGPHAQTGWRQVIESIRANAERVRIVASELGLPPRVQHRRRHARRRERCCHGLTLNRTERPTR